MTPRTRARRPVALVTGASSGIGEALAGRFAAGGHDVVLVARTAARLEALAAALRASHGVEAWTVVADLAQRGAGRDVAAALKRARRPVDVLVNCAGVLEHGRFVDLPLERQLALVDLNVAALTEMLACFVPPMVARGRGRVLNVASIAGFMPVPTLATYAATKTYVLSITEALSEELQGTGVTATALCPGITATHMLTAAQRASAALKKVPGLMIGTADSVAAEGYAACMAGEVIRVPGALNAATAAAAGAMPKWLVRRVAGAVTRASV